jgi:uncharacterized protein
MLRSFAFLLVPGLLGAQTPPDIVRERADYVAWLTSASTSPLAALAQQPVGPGVRLGPADAEVPLEGVPPHLVSERGGAILLQGPDGARALPRGRPFRLGRYTLTVDGPNGRAVLTLFGDQHHGTPPGYYSYDPTLVLVGPLAPPEQPGSVWVLAVDGIEVEATEAGSMVVPIGGERVRLRVRRIPVGRTEESDLEIYFRDGTNGQGSYPAGRFVSLVAQRDGRYRLDFNRARNPFCAYSTAYPCPAPWPGNAIQRPIEAGERYLVGGLAAPPEGAKSP